MKGRISSEEYLSSIRKFLQPTLSISNEELQKVTLQLMDRAIPETCDLKERLGNLGYSCGVLSNVGEMHHKKLSERYASVVRIHNGGPAIFSYQIGAIKPEPQIYERVRDFDKVIFIDDKELYLSVGSKNFGWSGIHFTPYIEAEEPTRKIHGGRGDFNKDIKKANSIDELVSTLNGLGIPC